MPVLAFILKVWPSAHLKPCNAKSEYPVNFFGQLSYKDLFVDNLNLGRLNDLKETANREKPKFIATRNVSFFRRHRLNNL